jgi:hypothetical protein
MPHINAAAARAMQRVRRHIVFAFAILVGMPGSDILRWFILVLFGVWVNAGLGGSAVAQPQPGQAGPRAIAFLRRQGKARAPRLPKKSGIHNGLI